MEYTEEQKGIINFDPYPGEVVKVNAFAGTGKTTLLKGYTLARPNTKFLYVCFNKAIQEEAKRKFPLEYYNYIKYNEDDLPVSIRADIVLHLYALKTRAAIYAARDIANGYILTSKDREIIQESRLLIASLKHSQVDDNEIIQTSLLLAKR